MANLELNQAQKQQIINQVKAGLEANANYQALPEEQKSIILQFSQNSAITAANNTAKETAKQVASTTAQTVAEQIAGEVASQVAPTIAQTIASQTAQTTATTTAKQVANEVKQQAQNQVIEQMKPLSQGLEQLTNGLGSLKEGSSTLQKGANQLDQGANSLTEGIKTFHEQGIQKICDILNGDLKNVDERIKKLRELSESYNNFTKLQEGQQGNTKFVMIIDAIKKPEEKD